MAKKVLCDTHGETDQAFVCHHLVEKSFGLGFNREAVSIDDPFPDAWCDNCELIRAAHGDWTDEAQNQTEIKLICSGCYERSRIRNTRPALTLDDLAGLRWKCASCEKWHTGPLLDLSFSAPHYWSSEEVTGSRWKVLRSGEIEKTCQSFLDSDYCAIDDRDFFVRGIIELPILGTAESFRWGVWGSLSRENFEALLRDEEEPGRVERPPMFSWLSSQISDYPKTLSLKMHAHIQEPGARPQFHLERCDNLLAREFHEGIAPERVRDLMFRALPAQPE